MPNSRCGIAPLACVAPHRKHMFRELYVLVIPSRSTKYFQSPRSSVITWLFIICFKLLTTKSQRGFSDCLQNLWQKFRRWRAQHKIYTSMPRFRHYLLKEDGQHVFYHTKAWHGRTLTARVKTGTWPLVPTVFGIWRRRTMPSSMPHAFCLGLTLGVERSLIISIFVFLQLYIINLSGSKIFF